MLDQISNIGNKEVITCFEGGLAPNSLKTNLFARPSTNRANLFERARRIDSVETPLREEKGKKKEQTDNTGHKKSDRRE